MFSVFGGAFIIVHFIRHRDYVFLYKSKINGRIAKAYPHKDLVYMRIQNNEFNFVPKVRSNNQYTIFDSVSTTGDSVFKNHNSDTLKLIHNGEIHSYIFEKQ